MVNKELNLKMNIYCIVRPSEGLENAAKYAL